MGCIVFGLMCLAVIVIVMYCLDMYSDYARVRLIADRDQWRRKAEYFRDVAIDGATHPFEHVCGERGEGTYEQCVKCWDNAAAAAATKEADDEPS